MRTLNTHTHTQSNCIAGALFNNALNDIKWQREDYGRKCSQHDFLYSWESIWACLIDRNPECVYVRPRINLMAEQSKIIYQSEISHLSFPIQWNYYIRSMNTNNHNSRKPNPAIKMIIQFPFYRGPMWKSCHNNNYQLPSLYIDRKVCFLYAVIKISLFEMGAIQKWLTGPATPR